jgi:MraZ protein
VFLGSYRHQVDAKGRVAVPAQFRRGLPPGSVVAFGPEGRLVIRDPEGWAALAKKYGLTSETPQQERRFLRQLFASARPVELDAQGRVLLDAEHRRFAGIEDRAVFVGLGDCVEVVGERAWNDEHGDLTPEVFTALNDTVFARSGPPAGSSTPA